MPDPWGVASYPNMRCGGAIYSPAKRRRLGNKISSAGKGGPEEGKAASHVCSMEVANGVSLQVSPEILML